MRTIQEYAECNIINLMFHSRENYTDFIGMPAQTVNLQSIILTKQVFLRPFVGT